MENPRASGNPPVPARTPAGQDSHSSIGRWSSSDRQAYPKRRRRERRPATAVAKPSHQPRLHAMACRCLHHVVGRVFGLIVSLAISGCAHKGPTIVDPLGAAPQDFSVDLTVMTGSGITIEQQAKL